MTQKPISIPISFFALFVACSALAGGGPFPETAAPPQPKAVTTDPGPCAAGEAYTCKLQCGPTTRTFWDRWVNNAGAEACVVLNCVCERQVVPVNLNDPTQPIALVIFGVRQLLPGAPQ